MAHLSKSTWGIRQFFVVSEGFRKEIPVASNTDRQKWRLDQDNLWNRPHEHVGKRWFEWVAMWLTIPHAAMLGFNLHNRWVWSDI
jgi:hypothetical protein